jgi:hypothetical protein
LSNIKGRQTYSVADICQHLNAIDPCHGSYEIRAQWWRILVFGRIFDDVYTYRQTWSRDQAGTGGAGYVPPPLLSGSFRGNPQLSFRDGADSARQPHCYDRSWSHGRGSRTIFLRAALRSFDPAPALGNSAKSLTAVII